MKKFIVALDTMFIVPAKNEEEACKVALEYLPDFSDMEFQIMEDVTEDEAFKDWKDKNDL